MKKIISLIPVISGSLLLMFMWVNAAIAEDLPLAKLNLPDGFEIEIYAQATNPRQLALSDGGILYAGSFREGNLYAVFEGETTTIDTGLNMPTGLALKDGDLYVAAVETLYVYRDIDNTFASDPEPEILYNDLPDETHHGWKYLGFGPDGDLYFNIGAPCNVCLEDNPWFSTIMRLDLDTSPLKPEIYAHGVRNTVGFTWHPESGDLWFTDNGRDWMGDEIPPCEVNRATEAGTHFGFPFIHGENVKDPEFWQPGFDSEPPVAELDAHVAPLGLKFYIGDMFPARYRGKMIVAEHGSWNRTPEAGHVGYRLTLVDPETGEWQTFIDGWLQDNVAWGRPADILEMPDGSLLIADDHGHAIYRLFYQN